MQDDVGLPRRPPAAACIENPQVDVRSGAVLLSDLPDRAHQTGVLISRVEILRWQHEVHQLSLARCYVLLSAGKVSLRQLSLVVDGLPAGTGGHDDDPHVSEIHPMMLLLALGPLETLLRATTCL